MHLTSGQGAAASACSALGTGVTSLHLPHVREALLMTNPNIGTGQEGFTVARVLCVPFTAPGEAEANVPAA